jgi:hypothetical protein
LPNKIDDENGVFFEIHISVFSDDRYNILYKKVDINIFRGKRGDIWWSNYIFFRRYHRRKNSDDGVTIK